MWWTPSESMTVPSAKICRNMPNWLPSLERPRANFVKTGSAVVTAGLTRGLGATRGAGPSATGGVVTTPGGNPLKFETIGAGVSGEVPAGGTVPFAEPVERP